MKGIRALVVDDEIQMRRLLKVGLEAHGFIFIEAITGKEALVQFASQKIDLVILDLGLPDMSGIEVLEKIRLLNFNVPILILSAQNAEEEKVRALDSGADDYLTKPFGLSELLARIRVAMRKKPILSDPEQTQVSFADLEIDCAAHLFKKGGEEVHLTSTEWALLKIFIQNAGKILTHAHILREVWGPAHTENTHYLRVYIGALRKKIEEDPNRPKYIQTEAGIGYRLKL